MKHIGNFECVIIGTGSAGCVLGKTVTTEFAYFQTGNRPPRTHRRNTFPPGSHRIIHRTKIKGDNQI